MQPSSLRGGQSYRRASSPLGPIFLFRLWVGFYKFGLFVQVFIGSWLVSFGFRIGFWTGFTVFFLWLCLGFSFGCHRSLFCVCNLGVSDRVQFL